VATKVYHDPSVSKVGANPPLDRLLLPEGDLVILQPNVQVMVLVLITVLLPHHGAGPSGKGNARRNHILSHIYQCCSSCLFESEEHLARK